MATFEAVANNDVDRLKALLNAGADPGEAVAELQNFTALHVAALHGAVEAAQLLEASH